MNPAAIQVKHCRACNSERVLDLGIRRNYYLSNLDQSICIPYAVCQDCHFIFQSEYVGDEFLDLYYQQSPMLRRKEPTLYEVDQNKRQGEFLSRHVDLEGKRVLEIGAHAGAFLSYLHHRFGCTAYFEELSEEARSVLASQECLCDFRGLEGDQKVDVVILRHVLEHIFNLDDFLAYLQTILAYAGSLFIEVPDWTHLDAHTDPFIFEHLNHFNSASLVNLLRRIGWQVDALEKSINPEDPATPNRVLRVVAHPTKLPLLGDASIVDFFSTFSALHYDGWKTVLNKLLDDDAIGSSIALYPASHLTFEALVETRLGEFNILGMFDIDVKKQGREILGLKVFSPVVLKDYQPDFILIFTMAYEPEIRESFKAMGLTSRVISISELISDFWN